MILLIVAHPNPASFNHAIAQTVKEQLETSGHNVRFHDLHAEGFSPVLPYEEFDKDVPLPSVINQYCEELTAAEGIVIVHPNWWGQPPAILKGWIDRVIRPGVAYRFDEGDSGEGVPIGLLKARAALVFNTANTSAQREIEIFRDPLQTLWKNCIFELCGVKTFHRRMFTIVVTSTRGQRKEWLKETRQIVSEYFPSG